MKRGQKLIEMMIVGGICHPVRRLISVFSRGEFSDPPLMANKIKRDAPLSPYLPSMLQHTDICMTHDIIDMSNYL